MREWKNINESKPKDREKCLVEIWGDIYSAEYVEMKSRGVFFPIYDAISTQKEDGYGTQSVQNAEFYEQPIKWMPLLFLRK